MKQSLISVITLSLFFAACKKDSTTTVTTETPVTKYIQSTVSVYDSIAIEYNMDKSVYRYLDFHRNGGQFFGVLPNYEAGKITKTVATSDSLFSSTYNYQTVTYNSVGQISSITYFSKDGSPMTVDSLLYDSNGKLDSTLLYQYNSGTNAKELTYKYAYTWDTKDNIIKQEEIYVKNTGSTTTYTYTYDDKINPVLKVSGYYLMEFSPDDVATLLSANNMLTTSATGADYTYSSTNTYVYDADNYPASLISRSSYQNTGAEPQKDSVSIKIIYGK
ncbi:hypothetical protein SAMN05428988_5801 [Chitinophaga sp. YR573]|uniref:hypothetical protein n=1 Tax=Chitinophaga sp. YR573 TaxID=1881040 RepID=UPI0008B001FF|nr:hypothetical protein [Chitinophaga sp. YR573]SEW44570.1 hypothetical protein SAMN05428988_5801 [Chitinophaga sp. YR573]